jgi:hypothetical protein
MSHQREGRSRDEQPGLDVEIWKKITSRSVQITFCHTGEETSAGPVGFYSQESMSKASYISQSMFTVTVSAKLSYNGSPELLNWADPPHLLILLLFFVLFMLTTVSLVHVVMRTGPCFYAGYLPE